ncbi:MAG TPA: hypothetical protein DEH78_11945 [Solibacterales bacterium]|nr:hypothetical protein [Bryobacterales bacterium]
MPVRDVERVAILPFENLTGDASADWLARGFPAILASQWAGSKSMHAFPAASARDAYANRATRLLHGYLRRDTGAGRLLVASLEDLASVRSVSRFEIPAGNWFEAARRLASDVDPSARPFPVSRPELIPALLEARTPALAEAVAKDPSFAAAHLALVRQLGTAGQRAEALETARRALAAKLPAIEEAEMRLVISALENDLPGRRKAAESLAALRPSDADIAVGAALLATNTGDQTKAVALFEGAQRSDPGNADLWNQAGYAAAYAGDFDKARSMIGRYRAMLPASANPLDSLGDVHFRFGRLKEAEQLYLDAYQTSPTFGGGLALWKAALAAHLAGDAKAAATHAARFLEQREKAGDPTAPLRRARWEYLSGNRDAALARLANLSGPLPALLAAAWRADVSGAGSFAKPEQKAAYALELLLRRRFQEAEPLLREIKATPNREISDKAGFLLAGALLELGRKQEAAPVLAYWPIPDSDPDPLFETLALPRIAQWKRALR